MKKGREIIAISVMGLVYAVFSVRYFPGRPVATLTETSRHLLSTIPFVLGLALVSLSVFKRLTGERPSFFFSARIFLTIGIFIEFFYGLYMYLGGHQ